MLCRCAQQPLWLPDSSCGKAASLAASPGQITSPATHTQSSSTHFLLFAGRRHWRALCASEAEGQHPDPGLRHRRRLQDPDPSVDAGRGRPAVHSPKRHLANRSRPRRNIGEIAASGFAHAPPRHLPCQAGPLQRLPCIARGRPSSPSHAPAHPPLGSLAPQQVWRQQRRIFHLAAFFAQDCPLLPQ